MRILMNNEEFTFLFEEETFILYDPFEYVLHQMINTMKYLKSAFIRPNYSSFSFPLKWSIQIFTFVYSTHKQAIFL